MNVPFPAHPGPIVLFGSGETLASSGKTHEFVAQQLADSPRIAILETPAGFEPNSDRVAGKIAEFLARRLQNYHPDIQVLPARKRGTPNSPDSKEIVTPILGANWLLLGPGSPTYAARQLRDTLALQMIQARHQLGATLMLSSSATLAFSAQTMPVYEIYKVGEELHWKPGLDYFRQFGLSLIIVPHWDNSDGGEELDTSRCYMGRARFQRLRQLLPADHTILGLDEHTSLIIDLERAECQVMGAGQVIVLRDNEPDESARVFRSGERFTPDVFGDFCLPQSGTGVTATVWEEALLVQAEIEAAAQRVPEPDPHVVALAAERTQAREQRQWHLADDLRNKILALGWQVMDTPTGTQLVPGTDTPE